MPQFLDLPTELIHIISGFLDDDYTINCLVQTNRRLFTLLNPALYLHHAQSEDPIALEWAARHGFERTARYALEAGISPNEFHDEKWLPLPLACIYGHEGVVRILLKHGVDFDAPVEWCRFEDDDDRFTNEDYGYPAALAARRGHESILKLLMEYDAPIDEETERDDTPLGMAAGAGHLSIVKFLVDQGCEIDMQSVPPLCLAAESGHLEIVRYLLEEEADQDAPIADTNDTSLYLAASNGHSEVIKLLLKYEARLSIPGEEFKARPLYGAVNYGHMAAAEVLREAIDLPKLITSGDAGDDEHAMLVLLCAACGWESMLRKLLERGCSPDACAPSGHLLTSVIIKGLSTFASHYGIIRDAPPLSFAAYYGHLGTTLTLLEYNASLCESQNELTHDPLVLAVSQSHLPVVRALIEAGANPNHGEQIGDLIMRQAVPSPEIFEFLLDQGASLDQKKSWNESLLEKVLKEGAVDIVKILQKRGIFGSRLHDERGDALVYAAAGGVRMVECLLEHGYKVTPNSEEAQLALMSATKGANTKLINLLYARGLVFDISVVYRRNLLGCITCPSPDIEQVASTLDTLLAHGVDITAGDGPLFHVLDRKSRCKVPDMDHTCDDNEIEQYVSLLLDRGADPLQSRRRSETFPLSAAAHQNKSLVNLMLKALDGRKLCLEQLREKLLYAAASALRSGNPAVVSLVRRACLK